MISIPIMARAGWRGCGTGREDAIGVGSWREAGTAALPLPSPFFVIVFYLSVPRVEEMGLRESLHY